MNKNDIALSLTLKAIEVGSINFQMTYSDPRPDVIEKVNEFNAKQVSDYFNSLVKGIDLYADKS